MIRQATLHDIPQMLNLCRSVYETTAWGRLGFVWDEWTMRSALALLVTNKDADVAVVTLPEEVVGISAVTIQPFAWNSGLRIASELIWHMHPSLPSGVTKTRWLLRLFDRMQTWAQGRSDVFKLNTFHGDAPMGKALSRRGMTAMETVYVQEVPRGD